MSIAHSIALSIVLAASVMSCAKKQDSGSGGGGGSATPAPGSGTLALQLQAKAGAPPETIAGANVTAQNHPEIAATSDENGTVSIEGFPPGSVNLIVTSSASTALVDSAAAYGLKIDAVVVKSGELTDLGPQTLKQTGSVHGTISYYTNPNNLELVGSDVYVPGTSFAAKTDNAGAFTIAGLPVGLYDFRIEHTGFAPQNLQGIEIKEAEVTELGAVPLSLSTGPEGSINVVEDIKVIIGGKTAKIVKTSTVKYQLRYDADAALMKVSDEPAFLNQEWKPVATDGTMVFEDEDKQPIDGKKTIYVMYSDLNGLESSPYSAEVYVDTEVPVISDVRLLYGWGSVKATDSSATIPMSIDATDSGAGINTVSWSLNADFSAATTGPFSPDVEGVVVSGGIGSREVFVKVTDYAGRESTIKSDKIALAGETVIAKRDYTQKIHLISALSPYLITEEVQVNADLEIDPGVTLSLTYPGKLDVRGKFTAIGSLSKKITISSTVNYIADNCTTTSMPHLTFTNALPGVTSDNQIKFAVLQNLILDANGGSITDSTLQSPECTDGNGGVLAKSGLDPLVVKRNTFHNWGNALWVSAGNKLTTFESNSGEVGVAYRQSGTAANTVYKDNSFDAIGKTMAIPILVENENPIDFGNSLITGQDTNSLIGIDQSVASVSISHLRADACGSIVEFKAKAQISFFDSSFDNCVDAMRASGDRDDSTVTFEHSNVGILQNILKYTGENTPNVTVTASNLECISNRDYFCNFFVASRPEGGNIKTTFTIQGSNVTCPAGVDAQNRGCGGFLFRGDHFFLDNTIFDLDLLENHYTHKNVPNPLFTIDNNDTASDHEDASQIALIRSDKGNCGSGENETCIKTTFDVTVTNPVATTISGAGPRN